MPTAADIALTVLIFAAAALYASVGHAGASGYLAAMALFGVAPAVMKPTALALNILVAAIASFKFWRASCFSWRLFWPFAVTSIPLAFLGGSVVLPSHLYKPVVGVVLLYAAWRLAKSSGVAESDELREPPLPVALGVGAGIGFLSGLTGVGGGIFLSPLLLIMKWADARRTAGVAAVFIAVNSIAGLAGHATTAGALPQALPVWAVAAVAGGWIGAEFGSRRLGHSGIRRMLAVVLVVAGLKMIFT